jgi:hypothetical protein
MSFLAMALASYFEEPKAKLAILTFFILQLVHCPESR